MEGARNVAKGRIRSAIKKSLKKPIKKPIRGARRLKSVTKSVTKSAAARVMGRIGTVKQAFENIDAELKLHHYKVREFEPKIRLGFTKGHFTVKTVDAPEELEAALRLRFTIFHKEYMQKRRSSGVDVDKLDFVCDHLIIRDDRSGEIVGTYRLNSSTYSDTFYSSGEFEIDELLAQPGNKLELGRACISKDYRTGVVIALLWRGISEYMLQTKTDIMFGCASVKTIEPLEIGLVMYHLMQKNVVCFDYGVTPTRKYKVKSLKKVLDYIEKNPYEYNEEAVAKMVPSLFQSYIKMGIKVYGEPALDRDFHCIDFLVVMKTAEMLGSYKRRYAGDQ